MARQISIGLLTEGVTDQRFLKSIVERTFKEISHECSQQITIGEFKEINTSSGLSFVEKVLEAAKTVKRELGFGMTVLCVQADADKKSAKDTYKNKINPAKKALAEKEETEYCKILVAIVPVQEIEAWMLADKELLKSEIRSKKTNAQLGIARPPEKVANPKEIIENAIRIVEKERKRRGHKPLKIAALYQPIGNEIDLKQLDKLPSYQDFKENAREAFRSLNLLHK